LWAANGNDDGDELTTAVEDPGLLGTGTHCLALLPTVSFTLCLASNPPVLLSSAYRMHACSQKLST
jgi:hypothetical protein